MDHALNEEHGAKKEEGGRGFHETIAIVGDLPDCAQAILAILLCSQQRVNGKAKNTEALW